MNSMIGKDRQDTLRYTYVHVRMYNSLVPSPSFWVERKGEKEGLGDNPGWKCPESRNSATDVDYESWPQLQGAKPLRRKSRKPDQVDIARYSKEQIDAAIDAAVQAFGLESLKHQQQKAIEEFVSGRDVFVALPAGFGKSYCFALLPTVFDHLRAGKEPSIMVCVSPVTW